VDAGATNLHDPPVSEDQPSTSAAEKDGPKPLLSVVCPVFNEEDSVGPFWERLRAVLDSLSPTLDAEVIFTNNRSTDGTAEAILALRKADPRIQLLTLSKNHGYQYSVWAGIRQAAGDAMVVIDVDCEDPPEMIPQFVEGWREGHDLIYGLRDRREEPFFVTWMRKLFYRINRVVADSDIILDMAEFSLFTAPVRDAVVSSRTTFPFIRAELAHYGFSRKGIRYDREKRVVGKTHYNFWGMTRFAIAGILSSTTVPLRLPLYFLPILFLLDVGHFFVPHPQAFQAVVLINLFFLCGTAAILGLYQSRTYRNVTARPVVVVDWKLSAINGVPNESPNDVARLQPPRGGEP
jgi:dolichol-phosphate mannosyltransferase